MKREKKKKKGELKIIFSETKTCRKREAGLKMNHNYAIIRKEGTI